MISLSFVTVILLLSCFGMILAWVYRY